MKKRGMFFSIDALIAFTIILTIVLVAFPLIKVNKYETPLSRDLLLTLSSIKIGEINDPYIKSLVSSGTLDSNKTALEQIGVLIIIDEPLAKTVASTILKSINTTENIGIWYGNKLIYSSNSSGYDVANNIYTERYIVSGLGGLNNTGLTSGYSARGFLSGTYRTAYAYFGGYIGDGNITKRIEYQGNISSAELEIAINNNFTLYINGVNSGTYEKSPSDTTPAKYSLNNYTSNFISGVNDLEFKGNNLYIAGGFIKITYNTNASAAQETKQYLAGIDGTVNTYDGISANGQLNSMEVSLHYKIPYQSFLVIGNTTIWNGSSAIENTTLITNAQLSSMLNYNQLSNTTTPIRFGSENFSLLANLSGGNADVILITDVSGSMNWRMDADTSTNSYNRNCADPLLGDPSTKRISLAKCLDQEFISIILSGTNNRVGVVSFSDDANSYVSLTTNITLLNNTINTYTPLSGTCVSCAINRAYLILQADSNSARKKYVIVMTDGVTNVRSTSVCYSMEGSAKTNTNTMAAQVGVGGAIANYKGVKWYSPVNPLWNGINNVDLLNDTLGFAVGISYQISKWNGVSWASQADLGSQNLYGISLFNDTLGFAVGDQGKIARWNGSSIWYAYQDTGNDQFKDVKIFNSTLAFAVGDSGKIFRWNGSITRWYEFQDLGNQDLKSIKMFNNTFGFIVGGPSGSVYRWNGTRWGSEQINGAFTLTDVDIFNETLAFATSDNDRIFKWTPNSWVSVFTGTADLKTITLWNSTYGFAAGWPREGVVVWNGSAWNNTYPEYTYNGNSTTGVSCNDWNTCSLFESAPMLNANYSSCRVHNEQNATVHAIGFGPVATCAFSAKTLINVAACGNGSYYASDNATQLQQIYANISQNILQLTYAQQTAVVTGNASGILYPDSYIKLNYTKPKNPFGLILSLEEPFLNTTQGDFQTYANSTVLDAQVTSYSGARWTEKVKLNGNNAYNINNYGSLYTKLGDPYSILLPIASILTQNSVVITTGVAPTNTTEGSASNKIIYTLAKNFSSFSPISANAQGCNWNIQFDDYSNLTAQIPPTYVGPNQCYFPSSGSFTHDPNDAFQVAVYNLLLQLDLDRDNKVNPKFTEQALQIDVSQITGIPFTWYSEVQIRVWT